MLIFCVFTLFLIKHKSMETLNNEFSKNQLQLYFNQIKGEVVEILAVLIVITEK